MTDRTHEEMYRRKLKTRDELREAIGLRPRDRKVIMCHGTFDLVHPGHVRHLMYAKSKADILIASLTCDAFIAKAHFRPFVPQQLRAMNLAALEMVDYVLIDENETPIENIYLLQPDYFAKGYEYFDGEVQPKTQEEIDALNSFGGEPIFTPGDVVFSSSAFIEQARPNIAGEKLHALMGSESVTFDDLRSTLSKFGDLRFHVLGDTIVDSYVYGSNNGATTSKTPTLSLRYEREVDFVGGAAVVAKHLREAGADVVFTTVLGNDARKDFVLKGMEERGIECRPIVDATRPTTQKTVFIADKYRLLKVDKVDNRSISKSIRDEITVCLRDQSVDAYVFSDFRHGIFNRETTPIFIEALRSNALRIADSQVASRWGNILDFSDFDLITPNEKEARFALGDQDSVIRPLALELYKRARCKTLILKTGDRGIITYRDGTDDVRAFFAIDSFASNVVDPVGAGDALLSYGALGMAASRCPVQASIIGSLAAAVECERDGNCPVSPEEVLAKMEKIERQVDYR
jgi:rfaE bifunctional protein kinase chain/domain